MENEILKTSKEWEKDVPIECCLLIMDPDGWDRKNYTYSFEVERITKDEFKMRVASSTIQCHIMPFTKW